MASSSKKKTTFAKLNREAAVREKRQIKAARKAERKLDAEAAPQLEPITEITPDVRKEASERVALES